jgi:hypothetical protein
VKQPPLREPSVKRTFCSPPACRAQRRWRPEIPRRGRVGNHISGNRGAARGQRLSGWSAHGRSPVRASIGRSDFGSRRVTHVASDPASPDRVRCLKTERFSRGTEKVCAEWWINACWRGIMRRFGLIRLPPQHAFKGWALRSRARWNPVRAERRAQRVRQFDRKEKRRNR